MGSQNGAPIPIYNRGRQIGFRKDKKGNTVVSKLNEEMLKEIAEEGNGVYVRANASNSGLSYVLDEINTMEKTDFDSKVIRNYKSRFQLFLLLAFVFFVSREILPNSKKTGVDLFKTEE